MNDTLPKMHVCKSCGFMSTRGDEFEMVAGEKLCLRCADKNTANDNTHDNERQFQSVSYTETAGRHVSVG